MSVSWSGPGWGGHSPDLHSRTEHVIQPELLWGQHTVETRILVVRFCDPWLRSGGRGHSPVPYLWTPRTIPDLQWHQISSDLEVQRFWVHYCRTGWDTSPVLYCRTLTIPDLQHLQDHYHLMKPESSKFYPSGVTWCRTGSGMEH